MDRIDPKEGKGFSFSFLFTLSFFAGAQQWGSANAEMKDPAGENPELKGSPF